MTLLQINSFEDSFVTHFLHLSSFQIYMDVKTLFENGLFITYSVDLTRHLDTDHEQTQVFTVQHVLTQLL